MYDSEAEICGIHVPRSPVVGGCSRKVHGVWSVPRVARISPRLVHEHTQSYPRDRCLSPIRAKKVQFYSYIKQSFSTLIVYPFFRYQTSILNLSIAVSWLSAILVSILSEISGSILLDVGSAYLGRLSKQARVLLIQSSYWSSRPVMCWVRSNPRDFCIAGTEISRD